MKKALLITYDLQPPWDSGLKVYGRGLLGALQNIENLEVTTAHRIDELSGHVTKQYDYVHVVLTGLGPFSKALKLFKQAIIFKHIVTPAISLRNAFSVKICYSLFNTLEDRLENCFSSDYVAKSYFLDADTIVPPSVNTSIFVNTETVSEDKILSMLENCSIRSGLDNIQNRGDGLVLYSGPLTEDRFPYRLVLDALKQTNSHLLLIGRQSNNGAEADKLQEIISYANKIGIENRISAALKLLAEDEKVNLLNFGDVIIQPFAKRTQTYVAVDPPFFLLEAMSCGKPVITSKTYSFQSLINNGHNGYSIDWNDPSQLNRALNDCLNRDSIGNNAKQTVIERFSYRNVSEKISAIYNDHN